MMSRFSLERTRVERKPIAAKKLVLALPGLPPPGHRQHDAGGRSLSYREWLARCGIALVRQAKTRVTGPVDVLIEIEDCHPARDASHCIGAVEDLLVEAGILCDDRSRNIRRIAAEWAGIKGLRITLSAAGAREAGQ